MGTHANSGRISRRREIDECVAFCFCHLHYDFVSLLFTFLMLNRTEVITLVCLLTVPNLQMTNRQTCTGRESMGVESSRVDTDYLSTFCLIFLFNGCFNMPC